MSANQPFNPDLLKRSGWNDRPQLTCLQSGGRVTKSAGSFWVSHHALPGLQWKSKRKINILPVFFGSNPNVFPPKCKENEAVSKFIRKFPLSPLPHTLHLNNKNIWHVAWVAVRFYNTSTQWVPSWWVKCTTGFLLLLLLLVSVCRKEQEKEEENQEDLMRPPRKFGLLKALGGHGVVAVGSGGKNQVLDKTHQKKHFVSDRLCVWNNRCRRWVPLSHTHKKGPKSIKVRNIWEIVSKIGCLFNYLKNQKRHLNLLGGFYVRRG